MRYTHANQLFRDGARPKVRKSHCFLCHNELRFHSHETYGNACRECNGRATYVARGFLTPEESDRKLLMRMTDLSQEIWTIDGVEYYKNPDGTLSCTS